MEKGETERGRESELSFRWRFLFFRGMLQKKGGIWNVSGGILFSFGKVDSCK